MIQLGSILFLLFTSASEAQAKKEDRKNQSQKCKAIVHLDSSDQMTTLDFEIDAQGRVSRKAVDGSVYKEKWLLVACPENSSGKCLQMKNSREILHSECE